MANQGSIKADNKNLKRGDLAWVSKGKSSLVSEGSVNSTIPKAYSSSVELKAQADAKRQIESLLQACLHTKSKEMGIKNATLLLRGPKGCRKSSLVFGIGEQLGIHVNEVCYQVVSINRLD